MESMKQIIAPSPYETTLLSTCLIFPLEEIYTHPGTIFKMQSIDFKGHRNEILSYLTDFCR